MLGLCGNRRRVADIGMGLTMSQPEPCRCPADRIPCRPCGGFPWDLAGILAAVWLGVPLVILLALITSNFRAAIGGL